MLLITSPRFEEHTTPPGHPERPERAHVFDAVAARWVDGGGRTLEPRPATREELLRVHAAEYIDAIAATSGRPGQILDPDTFTSPESYEIALLAAGAATQAAEHALDRGEPAMALVRPPGHHAERGAPMGFCLFNNVAVAAAAARARGVSRVAIVDIDVHHGNGTQRLFYEDPTVLYVSTHQAPFYPGTGSAVEIGRGRGEGFTINVPLQAGATDADYARVYEVIAAVLHEYSPELLLISAGYDAHADDPLASMFVSSSGYTEVVRLLVSAVPSPLALVIEGGYDLTALRECIDGTIAVVDRARAFSPPRKAAGVFPTRAEHALGAVRAAQSPFWRAL